MDADHDLPREHLDERHGDAAPGLQISRAFRERSRIKEVAGLAPQPKAFRVKPHAVSGCRHDTLLACSRPIAYI